MTKQDIVDLFTLGLVIDEKDNMVANNKHELKEYLDNNSFIKPLNYHFLISLPTVNKTTKGGIHLPDEVIDTSLIGNNIGRVIGKGSTVGGATGNYADCKDLEIGDYISYNPHVGLPQNYLGHRVICMPDEAIKISIPDPTHHTDGIFKSYSIKGVK
jgi:co-chaperonin GroES (HSP10)